MKISKTNTLALSFLAFAACKSAETPPPAKPVAAVEAPKKTVEVKPADQLGAANQLFAKGEYQAAIDAYDAMLAKEQNEAAAFNRAVCLHRLGKLTEAAKAYQAILAKDPNDLDAALNLGAIYKDDGKVDEAIALYTKALKNDEYNSKVLNNLAALYRIKKQYPKAVDTVRKLLMRDQRNIDAYKNLALVYYDQKKYKLAQTILGNAVKMAEKDNKKDPDIFVNLGMIQIALGDNGKAMAAFKQALDLDPNHVVANYNVGSLALAHRDYGLAERSYAVVQKAWPESYEVAASMGYALQGQQKFKEAAQMLEKARSIKEKEAVASNEEENIVLQLWQIYQTDNDAKTALKYADEYLKLKNKTCREGDVDDVCGRYMGTQLMVKMQNQPAPAPEEKKKATGNIEVFTDAPPEAEAPPAEGGTPPEGQEAAPPAEGAEGAESGTP